jgi:hypothetical protein
MYIMDDGLTNPSRIVTGQVNPMQNSVVWVMRPTFDGTKTITLHQPGENIRNRLMITSQGFKEDSRVGIERLPTSRTVVTLLAIAKDFDVASMNSAKFVTGCIVTPMLFRDHDVSPPHITNDTPNGFHGLGSQYLNFTA